MIIVISVSPPSSSSARRFLRRGSPSESSSRLVELLSVEEDPHAFSDFWGRRGPASLASAGSSLARRGRRRGSSLAPALASPSSSAQPISVRGQPLCWRWKAVAEQKAAGGRRKRVVPVGGRRLVWMLPDLFFSNRRARARVAGARCSFEELPSTTPKDSCALACSSPRRAPTRRPLPESIYNHTVTHTASASATGVSSTSFATSSSSTESDGRPRGTNTNTNATGAK